MAQRKKVCPACGSKREFAYKQVHGIRLYREIRGRKVYDVECQDCRHRFEFDGGKADPNAW
jgi:hypothetical protein